MINHTSSSHVHNLMLSGKRKGVEEEAMGTQIEPKKPKNESMEGSSISWLSPSSFYLIVSIICELLVVSKTLARMTNKIPFLFISSPIYILKTGGEEAIDVDLEWQDEELLELEEQEHLWQMQHDEAIQVAQAAQAILHYPSVIFSIC